MTDLARAARALHRRRDDPASDDAGRRACSNVCYVFGPGGGVGVPGQAAHDALRERGVGSSRPGHRARDLRDRLRPDGRRHLLRRRVPGARARRGAARRAHPAVVPSCTDDRQGFLRVRYCAQARAIENQMYVIHSSTVGSLPMVPAVSLNYGQAVDPHAERLRVRPRRHPRRGHPEPGDDGHRRAEPRAPSLESRERRARCCRCSTASRPRKLLRTAGGRDAYDRATQRSRSADTDARGLRRRSSRLTQARLPERARRGRRRSCDRTGGVPRGPVRGRGATPAARSSAWRPA